MQKALKFAKYLSVFVALIISHFAFQNEASALSLAQRGLTVYDKSESTTVIGEVSSLGEEIAPSIQFAQLGDFITFKLLVEDLDGGKFRITSISDNNTNANITSSYTFDDAASFDAKNVYITLSYSSPLTDDLAIDDFELSINAEDIPQGTITIHHLDATSREPLTTDIVLSGDAGSTAVCEPLTFEGYQSYQLPEQSTCKFTESGNDVDILYSKQKEIVVPDTGHFSLALFNGSTPQQGPTIFTILIAVSGIGVLILLANFLAGRTPFVRFRLPQFRKLAQVFGFSAGLVLLGFGTFRVIAGIADAGTVASLKIMFLTSGVTVHVEPTAVRTVSFVNNGGSSVSSIASEVLTCDLYYSRTSCDITLPSYTVAAGTEARGWTTDRTAQAGQYEPGQSIAFSEDTTLYTITRRELSATFTNQHSDYFLASADSASCAIYNTETSCKIVSPAATKRSETSGAEFLGWNTDPSAQTAIVATGVELSITGGEEFYSVASIPTTTVVARFINNDAVGVSSLSSTSESCTLVDAQTSCQITVPDFSVVAGYEKIGWNTDNGSEASIYSPGSVIELSQSTVFYTISRRPLSASFQNQHSDYFTTSSNEVSCYAYNGASGCSVTTPTASKKHSDSHAQFLGWNMNASAVSGVAGNTSIAISGGETYYSIASIPTGTVTVSFVNNDSTGVTALDAASQSCTLIDAQTSCEITIPGFTVATGYTVIGWHTDQSATEALYVPGATISFSANTTLYTVSSRTLSAAFRNQHNDYFTISSNHATCTVFNGASSCTATTPTMTAKPSVEGAQFLGWNMNASAVSGVAGNTPITISGGETYYSIASVPTVTYSLEFTHENYDTETFDDVSYFPSSSDPTTMVKTCTVYPGNNSCEIETPEFVASSGWTPFGYDTKNPMVFTEDSDTFVGIGDSITVSSSNTGSKYYAIVRSDSAINATFVNQHQKYLNTSASSASCYVYDPISPYCSVYAPSLTAKAAYADATILGWTSNKSAITGAILPGAKIYLSLDNPEKTYYSAAYGIPYTITFNKNTDFSNSQFETSYYGQYNFAADSISFYSTTCVPSGQGCYLQDAPFIYASSKTPLGFSLTDTGSPITIGQTSFVNDTTLYARVGDLAYSGFSVKWTKKIGTSTDYYAIEFETGTDDDVTEAFADFIEDAFSNAPQLKELRGKMRFYTIDTYSNTVNQNIMMSSATSLMITTTEQGRYATIAAMPAYSDTVLADYTLGAAMHELGHAIDGLFKDKTGVKLSSQQDIRDQIDADNGGEDNNYNELFATAFGNWYEKKMQTGKYNVNISDEMVTLLEQYLCVGEYSSAPVCQ